MDLLYVNTLQQKVGAPGVDLLNALQEERRISLVYLSLPTAEQRRALDDQRVRTNQVQSKFRNLADDGDVSRAGGRLLDKRLQETFVRLDGLSRERAAIDAGQADHAEATVSFNTVIDAVFRAESAAGSVDDETIARDGRTLFAITRAKEFLSREDALAASVLATGHFTQAEYTQFVQLVGTQRFLHDEAAAELPPTDHARYQRLVTSAPATRLRALEDLLIQRGRSKGRLPVTATEWQAAIRPTLSGDDKVVLDGSDDLVDRAKPFAYGVILRLVLAGGLGLLAVIASVVLSVTTARALVRQLDRLRDTAWELANTRLPSVVERIGHGEKVDVKAEAPPLEFGRDSIGQVGRAFNAVQETAIRTAVEQAALRQGIRDILLSLARRTQALVHRQLTLLDAMERRETGAEELQDLFRIDHLATRMRRNAENLIVMSGATPARGWRRAVPMVDVVRGAVAEVEDYTRVNVLPIGPVALAGRAVGDITHLLAELIENAISFSPAYTTVQVGGHLAAGGFAIEIEDSGLGMSDDQLAAANAHIIDPPEFNLSSTARLGLYVVSRLAERYGVKVTLKHSPYGGTTAVVLIPRDLVIEEGQEDTDSPAPGTEPRAAVAAPVEEIEQSNSKTEQRILTAVPAISEPGAPSADPPVPAAPAPEMAQTPSGLPFRVPQASLAPPLRTDGPAAPSEPDEDDEPGRSPDEIRRYLGAYQSGTKRGRSAAAKAAPEQKEDSE